MLKRIFDYLSENRQYGKRTETDCVFFYPQYSRKIEENADWSSEFIQEWHLKDEGLWKLFVNQYRFCQGEGKVG